MIKLTIKIILCLLPLILTAITFELIARRIPNSYSAKVNLLMSKKDSVEILIMGSSHSNHGINPKYWNKEALNLANANQSLLQDYNILSKYLPECKKVRTVIIPISYFSLQYDMASSPEQRRCAYYSFYMDVKGAESARFDIRNHSALFLWDGPLGVIESMRRNKVVMNEYGYQPPDNNKTINRETGKKSVAMREANMYINLLGSNLKILERMLTEFKSKDIKIIFATIPVYTTFSQNITKNNYDIMTSKINNIATKYGVKYYNYFYDNRFDVSDFWDDDHLNEKGALKFSAILWNDMVKKQ